MRFPLVARSGAVSEIEAAVTAARGGHGALLLVTGEAGAGKTRLAEEVTQAAEGFRVEWVWCAPGGALRPWSRVVRALAGGPGGDLVRDSPDLAGLAGIGSPDEARDAETARWRLSLDLADLMRAAGPLLLVLDDLQDADESALRLLTEIVPALRSSPVLVLATARDGEHDWRGRAEVWGTLNRLGRQVRPLPFTGVDVRRLAAAAGLAPSPAAIDAITRRTKGNPLLVCELLASGATDLATAVPASLRSMVAARLAGVSEQDRSTLACAAVLGSRFPLEVLAGLTGRSLTDVGALVADGADLIERAGPGDGRFRHELIRAAVHEALPPGERVQLHRRAADVLVAHAGRGRDVAAAEIAGHLLAAGPEAVADAAEWARIAGAEALRRLAFEDAVRWCVRTGECLAALGAPDAERARCGIALGTALTAAGDRTRARTCLLDAAERADRAGRADLVAEAVLGIGSGPAGFEVGLLDQRQIDLLARVRARPLPDPVRALVTARLSVALSLVGSPGRRLGLAREAVTLARRGGDDTALASALAALCDAMAGPEHCRERLDAATEIVTVAQRLRDPLLLLLGHRLRVVALLETGQPAGADAEIVAYRAVAETVRHPLYLWYVPLWRGMRALAERRFDDCRAALAEAAGLGARAGSENAVLLTATQRWLLCAESGDQDGLAAMFAEFDRLDLPGVWPRITRAVLLTQLGRMAEARAQLDAVAPLVADMPRDSEWLPAMAQLAEAVAAQETPHPLAGPVRDALTPYADLFVVEGIGAALRGPVRRFLDLLAGPDAVADDEFRHDRGHWVIRHSGVESRLPDSKGLRDLGTLLARPGTSVAALDLAGAVVEHDTGPVLDATARAAYRQRLRDLDAEAGHADATGDLGHATRIAAERDALLAELTGAYGLGGRARRTGSSAERARTAVTARIRYAIRRIAATDPRLAAHLRRSVRTGTFCVYDPEPPVSWKT